MTAVADDPEGAQVFAELQQARLALPPGVRSAVHLAMVPMDDEEENAAIVNALQRHAAVVVQKSLQEGFGLTVIEAMLEATARHRERRRRHPGPDPRRHRWAPRPRPE